MLTAGFVLVGGKSSRMGRDKALLPWKAGVLVEDVAVRVAAATGSVSLVGDPARYGHLRYRCIPDLRPGLGPLGGIETALASGFGELNLILGCDMPEIDISHLSKLVAIAKSSEARCVITEDASGAIHPLCGVYRSACLPAVKTAIDDGRYRLMCLVEDLRATVIAVPDRIRNINTMQEWNHGY